MIEITFEQNELTPAEQQTVSSGFLRHAEERSAPRYDKKRLKWLACENEGVLLGVLTCDLLWDWLYIDELWVDEKTRGTGLGKRLMQQAEDFAVGANLSGLWLWTQSWQAADFYQHLGYQEFTRFPDFPKGHFRFGFRKQFLKTT